MQSRRENLLKWSREYLNTAVDKIQKWCNMQTSSVCSQVVILQFSLLWYAVNQSRLMAGLFDSATATN